MLSFLSVDISIATVFWTLPIVLNFGMSYLHLEKYALMFVKVLSLDLSFSLAYVFMMLVTSWLIWRELIKYRSKTSNDVAGESTDISS